MVKHALLISLVATLLVGFETGARANPPGGESAGQPALAVATFAGGCFWCMEPPFDDLDGVVATLSGYTGGWVENPTYEQVTSGTTGHAEAVQVVYDPARITYEKLLDVFWRNIDPTTPDRQFVDVGAQYRPAIFYHDEDQRRLAEQSRDRLGASGRFAEPIRTEIVPAAAFYPAEDYHQDYYKKNPIRYKLYRYGSGRDAFLERVWGSGGGKR